MTPYRSDEETLRARVAELERENERLRSRRRWWWDGPIPRGSLLSLFVRALALVAVLFTACGCGLHGADLLCVVMAHQGGVGVIGIVDAVCWMAAGRTESPRQ